MAIRRKDASGGQKTTPNTLKSGDLQEEELQQVTVDLNYPDDNKDSETAPFIQGGQNVPPPPKPPKTPQQKLMAVAFYWYFRAFISLHR